MNIKIHLYPFPVDEELLLQSGPEIEKKRDGNVCALRVENCSGNRRIIMSWIITPTLK